MAFSSAVRLVMRAADVCLWQWFRSNAHTDCRLLVPLTAVRSTARTDCRLLVSLTVVGSTAHTDCRLLVYLTVVRSTAHTDCRLLVSLIVVRSTAHTDCRLLLSFRFCGPATTVDVHTPTRPRLQIRTEAEAVAETGLRFSRLVLTPDQVSLLSLPDHDDRSVCVQVSYSWWLWWGPHWVASLHMESGQWSIPWL